MAEVKELAVKQDPSLVYLIQEYHDGLLLYEASNRMVWQKAAADKVGLKSYYKKHKKNYVWDSPRFKGHVIHARNEKLLLQAEKFFKKHKGSEGLALFNKEFKDSLRYIRVKYGVYKVGEDSYVDAAFFGKDAPKPSSIFPANKVNGKLITKPETYEDVLSQVISDYQEVSDEGVAGKCWDYSHISGPFALDQLSQEDADKWFIHAICYRTNILRSIHYRQTEGIAYTDHEWSFTPLSAVKTCFSFDKPLYRYTVGRDGQSIAPALQARNLWMEAEVMMNMVRTLHKLQNDGKTDNLALSFMENILHKDLLHLYQLYLVTYANVTLSLEPLTNLDQLLKHSFPELYNSLDEYTTRIAGVIFTPINNWRESRSGLLFIQRLVYSIANTVNILRK